MLLVEVYIYLQCSMDMYSFYYIDNCELQDCSSEIILFTFTFVVLSVLLRFTDSDYPLGIFKLVLHSMSFRCGNYFFVCLTVTIL